ncbi:MAG: (deoxy)nucleoside triphosphate pyrophosphohydrolase [Candidatus Coproplasma sp.]
MNNNNKPYFEVVAALIWQDDRFLICQRPAHKARGLLWEFVGGKVEAGETKEQAIVRECREELGITVQPHGVFCEITHDYEDIDIRLTLFNCTIVGGVPTLLEHNDMRWITVEQIPLFSFCPADSGILNLLQAK